MYHHVGNNDILGVFSCDVSKFSASRSIMYRQVMFRAMRPYVAASILMIMMIAMSEHDCVPNVLLFWQR
jgi:hypothetical protein